MNGEVYAGQEGTLQLQDIQVVLAASPAASQEVSGAAAASNFLAAGQFLLSNQQHSAPQAAHPHPLATPLAHHWSWCRTATSLEASAGASASQTMPNTIKASGTQPRTAPSEQGESRRSDRHPIVYMVAGQDQVLARHIRVLIRYQLCLF